MVDVDTDRPDVLTYDEAETYVNGLKPSDVWELGSIPWLKKHHQIKQLAFQSAVQAMSNREEYVKELLISESKLPIIIHDLLLVELWRENIFEKIESHDPHQSSMTIYPILYHEAVAMNLMEITLFHSESFETMGDTVVDFVDYCLRAMNRLLIPVEENKCKNAEPTIRNQCENLLTGISFKAVTCLRFLIENIESIGRGLVSRLTISTDTPMLLVDILLHKPWIKTLHDKSQVYYSAAENDWKPYKPSLLLNPVEIQTWLSLYLLLKNNDILSAYELFDHRKEHLLKLRPLFNTVMTDQIPLLSELQLFLNQLAVHSGPLVPTKKNLLIEMIPQVRESLEKIYSQNLEKLLHHFEETCIHLDPTELMSRAQALSDVYSFESFEAVLPTKHNCGLCGKDAERKCGKCKKIWYCGRECQVKHWKIHKEQCM